MKFFTLALASASLIATGIALEAPVHAQAAKPAPQRVLSLSKAEQAAINPLTNAVIAANTAGAAANWPAVRALLPAAEAAAKGKDARYAVARAKLSLGIGTKDVNLQEQAINALIANSATPANEMAVFRAEAGRLVEQRAEAAFAANDFATAERLYGELLKATPGDTRLQNNLRIVQQRSGNTGAAVETALQQIRAAEAAGGIASETLYQNVFKTYYLAKQRPQALAAVTTLIRNYPTVQNVRFGVNMVREAHDQVLQIDALRLASAAKALENNQYLPFADDLGRAALPGETLTVIDAGIAAGALTSGQVAQLRTVAQRRQGEDRAGLPGQIAQARKAANGRPARIVADVLYGYGRYAEAAELYRLALTKGGEDANLINNRLGASLGMAGDKAGAEAAFRAVTGPRAELGQVWMAWLNRRT